MRRRWIIAPIVAIAVGAIVTFGLMNRPSDNGSQVSVRHAPCDASHGPGVSGVLPLDPKVHAEAVVQILPEDPYGKLYLDAVRRRAGLAPQDTNPADAASLAGLSHAMEYARVDNRGRFACGRLAAGTYYVVATLVQPNGIGVAVAQVHLTSSDGVTPLAAGSFKPLSEVR